MNLQLNIFMMHGNIAGMTLKRDGQQFRRDSRGYEWYARLKNKLCKGNTKQGNFTGILD